MTSQPKQAQLLTLPVQTSARKRLIAKAISLFIFFLFFTIPTPHSIAQFTYELDKTTRFEKMGPEEGLSSGYVTCLHQDKYGFIWIGTQYGLNLYDGYEVKVFYADPKNPQSLFNNFIINIFEETDGTMWFCTSMGISKYDRATHQFINYIADTINLEHDHNFSQKILQDGDYFWINAEIDLFRFNKETGQFRSFAKDKLNPSNGIYGGNVDYMFIDVSGLLWVGSSEPGSDFVLSRFNKETETFVYFINNPSDPESFVGKQVMSMAEDHEGTIWVVTQGGGLLEIVDKEKGKFRQYAHIENNKNSIIHNDLQKVLIDSNGNIWVGGNKGFSLLDKETGRFTNYQLPNRFDFANISNIEINIDEGFNGDLWISTRGGLFRFNPSTKFLSHYLNDPENLSSIGDNWAKQVINDRTGQTWVLTPNNSINIINPFSNEFRRIQKQTNVMNSLSGNSVGKFYTDIKGNFWVGCSHAGGLNRTKINNHKVYDSFEHFIFDADDPKSISGDRITALYEDRDQVMWIGTWYGLNRYDHATNSFTRFQHDPDNSATISQDIVMCIFEDSHGIFWVGTRNGLNIMDRNTGKFIRVLPDEKDSSSIASIDIRVIFEDSYGELWFGGSYLEKLIRKDTTFVHFLPDFRDKSDIYRSAIWGIKEDDSTNLWLSSWYGGLFKMNRNNKTFTSLTADQGFPSNNINSMEIDDRGFIWASTNQGLSRVDPSNYSIRNFDVTDGLISLEFINRSSYKDDEGWLYFGSRDGFNVFHPDSIKENKIIPPVYITGLSVAGSPKYFDLPLFEMSSIELQYNENDFSFDFVALNYINSLKNKYAYKLEGYDEDWNYVGSRRTAYYTNLSPGEYTFRVKGSNNDGYWNEEGASLAMVIYPPFWLTWWAYVVYAFAFFVLVYVLRRNELRKINLRQELELKQVQVEQQAELDIEKNKFFSNISHEFRTPLTLILGPLERLIASPKDENQKEQLNLVKRNARRLQTLINQLLSLSKLESGKMKLKARPENIVKLTGLFIQSFHSMAEDMGIKLDFESDVEECLVYIDPIKFEKIANNLLSNAFKFTERGDKIKVSITPLPPSLPAASLWQAGRGENPSPNKETTFSPPLGETQRGVQIKFSDTGMGIKKEDLPHVFDRFYQVDEKQMKTNLGTGIGLALTKELIELHHGTITAESEPGMGTTFTIFLLLGKDHLSADEIVDPGNVGLQTEDDLLSDDYLFAQDIVPKTDSITEVSENSKLPLILIVEDNDDMRSYIKSYLVDSYNIIEAANGKEGAEKAIEHIPDLIVSDLMMPKMDGNQMTIELKTDERTSHIPIILLTAKASKETKLEGLGTGADDFLTKPFDADELLVRIKNLIEQRRRLRKLLSQHIGDVFQTHIINEATDRGMNKIDEQFLIKATNIVDKQMSDPEFSVEMLSGEMFMSRMQLHRKLKGLIDQSASSFIRQLRLKKAAKLLKEGELNITQITYEVGISNPSYFTKAFKEQFGVTPSEYV